MNQIFFPDFLCGLIVVEIIISVRQTYASLVTLCYNTCAVFRILIREQIEERTYLIRLEKSTHSLNISNSFNRFNLFKILLKRSDSLFFYCDRIHTGVVKGSD